MLLKLKIAVTKQHGQVNQAWSAIAAYFRSRKQRSRDHRILSQMNDHNLRDIGLTRSQGGTHYRNP
jgi:uncharacterized protein YjiS (DUF1127 family)